MRTIFAPHPTPHKTLRLDGVTRRISRRANPLVSLTPTAVTAVPATALTSGHVTVIDRIVGQFAGRVAGEGLFARDRLTLRITDGTQSVDLPIMVPGNDTIGRLVNIDWSFGTSLVLAPGFRLDVLVSDNLTPSTADFNATFNTYSYILSRQDAREMGIRPISWNGTAFTGDGFARGGHPGDTSPAVIIPGKAGKSVQLEWLQVSAYADGTDRNLLVEFTDAASTHHKVFNILAKSNNIMGAQFFDLSGMEINGPTGFGVRITSSLANAFSVCFAGRYVTNHETMDPTGVHTGPLIPGNGRKFWAYVEGSGTGSSRFFGNSTSLMAHVTGTLMSASPAGPGIMTLSIAGVGAPNSIGPTMHVIRDQSMAVGGLGVPVLLPDAAASLHVIHGTGSGPYRCTVWGILRPASESPSMATTYTGF